MPEEISPEPQPGLATISVLRVAEGGSGVGDDGLPHRTFSVVLSRATDDLSIVATAKDPADGGAEIPTPGSPHPHRPDLAARAPLIFSVGLRNKGGAMIASHSNFFNVRVRYAAVDNGQRTMDSGQRTADNGQRCQLSTVNCAPERSDP